MKALTTWMSAVLLAGAVGVALAQQPAPPGAPEQTELEQQLDAARERLDVAAREVAALSKELSNKLGERVGDYFGRRDPRRPRAVLGVQIDNRTNAGGARIMAVSPGGAAEQAGLKAGDVIVAIDGEDLSRHASPGRGLVEEVRELVPGEKVKLRVLTADKTREVELTPRAAQRGTINDGDWRGHLPGGPHGGPGGRPYPVGRERDNFARMELASVSPRLGSYFGAKTGVLVVRSGDSAFQLEDGDVITAIDGREPTSAAHATRILHSYQRGEKLSIKVLRDRKPKVLEVTIAGG